MHKQEFFKKLEDEVGNHPLKDRIKEELQEHVDDSVEFQKRAADESIERLGSPFTIASNLKEIFFSFKRFVIYTAVYFVVLLPLSVLVSISLLKGQYLFDAFTGGFAEFFTIIVSSIVGFIFGYKKRFEYSQKEILIYGIGVEVIRIIITIILMTFTTRLYFMFDPDVRPYVPFMFLVELFLGGLFSWIGAVIGGEFHKNSVTKNPPMVGA